MHFMGYIGKIGIDFVHFRPSLNTKVTRSTVNHEKSGEFASHMFSFVPPSFMDSDTAISHFIVPLCYFFGHLHGIPGNRFCINLLHNSLFTLFFRIFILLHSQPRNHLHNSPMPLIITPKLPLRKKTEGRIRHNTLLLTQIRKFDTIHLGNKYRSRSFACLFEFFVGVGVDFVFSVFIFHYIDVYDCHYLGEGFPGRGEVSAVGAPGGVEVDKEEFLAFFRKVKSLSIKLNSKLSILQQLFHRFGNRFIIHDNVMLIPIPMIVPFPYAFAGY
mmetsp:Transcript_8951/g.11998  ORF Transcript_8951/g.11998 Transcript_8951/m.11998 type:complete len:272 (+) Transcript_8951:706-1521(+)